MILYCIKNYSTGEIEKMFEYEYQRDCFYQTLDPQKYVKFEIKVEQL